MNLGEKQGSFLSCSNIQFLHLNPTYLSQTAFGINLLVTNVVGSIFKTTRGNQDLYMELKVKLRKPINKKQEEKRK